MGFAGPGWRDRFGAGQRVFRENIAIALEYFILRPKANGTPIRRFHGRSAEFLRSSCLRLTGLVADGFHNCRVQPNV